MRLIFHRGKISFGWGLDRNGEVVRASQSPLLVDRTVGASVAIPEDWLERFNQQAAINEMPYHQRPFHALLIWTEEKGCSRVPRLRLS
jgi:hypothetical protein